ncbi:MAG TPA: hypothetical protein VMN78_08120 [Longimicrobiales bacterium]|nr:hypothetical protein [Longimicrobiales bacterium]
MSGATRRGAVAGIVAATTVALFFLVLDAISGQLLRTPAFMAALLTGSDVAGADVRLGTVALFTLVHYAVFIAVGVLVSRALASLGLRPMLLLGAVLGVIFFDIVFYGSLVVRGVDILAVLGWPAFLAGNLLGGLALMGYLDWTGPEETVGWREVLAHHRTIREGLVAGILGGFVVVMWFLLIDIIMREAFFTPAALGSAIFDGARGVAEVRLDPANVLGYTAVHFAAFFAVGLIAAAIAAEAERHGVVLLGAVLLFVTFETLFLGLTAIAANWLLDALNFWTILIANLLAAAAMGWYLWHAHPRLAAHLLRDYEEAEFKEADEADVQGAGLP